LSKSLAVKVQPVRRSTLVALAMGLSVAVVAVAPQHAWAKPGNGNGNSNGNGNAPAVLPLCTLADLSVAAAACSGFFSGNLLSNSGSDVTAQTSALSAIGLSNWDGSIAEPQIDLSSSLVNFQSALNGMTWIGVHFGGGANSPNPQGGGVTAFYRFDAGTNLDAFALNYGSASAARLYTTGPVPQLKAPASSAVAAVPEPASWALMILGFGAAGAILRRRRALVAA
jgi:hypothetical protein